MKAVTLGCALVLLALGRADAQPIQSRYLGEVSCGAWPKAKPVTDIEKAVPLNLVLGILFGRASQDGGFDALLRADVYQVAAWMDNYCAANPLDTIITGAMKLEEELMARAAQ